MGSWILILWLAPNASYIGATYNGSIETTQMYTKEGCVTALNFIIKRSQHGINGACVPNPIKD